MSVLTRLLLGLILGTTTLAACPMTHASTLETLYTFAGGADGSSPLGDLVLRDGMLYGTTVYRGVNGGCGGRGCGTVFKLDLTTRTLTTLHVFTGGADGGNPNGGMVLDTAGALYGTTGSGGTSDCGGSGCGTVFELDPAGRKLTTIYAFTGGADGTSPNPGMVFSNGVLYGTSGGAYSATTPGGTVFALDVRTRTLTTLYSFCTRSQCADGAVPNGDVVFDAMGVLYGTTSVGGRSGCGLFGCGTVFKLDPATRTLTTLHSFGSRSGSVGPQTGLVLRNARLFGTTPAARVGRKFYDGTIFKVDPATQHGEILHAFNGDDGATPSDLTARTGALYGTTGSGGNAGYGTIFKFDLETKTLQPLWFFYNDIHGFDPEAGVVVDTKGTLYGSTFSGGKFGGVCARSGCGTLFKLVP